tara:strand:+ start:103 stop:297 length:195 start_codon:yes stop_codon:yes gene_type:complete
METPYDYFLANLKMIENMVGQMRDEGTTSESIVLQIALLKDMIENLEKLKDSLSELSNKNKILN